MKIIYYTIAFYALIATLGALKGISVLSDSNERMNQAGFISTQSVTQYEAAKGCE